MYNLLIFDVSQHYILTINTKYDIITLASIAKHNNVVLWQRAYKRSALRRYAPPAVFDGGLQIVISICNSA
jgi:hypothetical protein